MSALVVFVPATGYLQDRACTAVLRCTICSTARLACSPSSSLEHTTLSEWEDSAHRAAIFLSSCFPLRLRQTAPQSIIGSYRTWSLYGTSWQQCRFAYSVPIISIALKNWWKKHNYQKINILPLRYICMLYKHTLKSLCTLLPGISEKQLVL